MLDEKDRLTDSLITEKYIAGGYNHAALEASNSQLLDTFAGILREEQQIQHEIFIEMNNRGWYQPKTANMNDLSQNINKWNQELQKLQSTALRSTGQQQQQAYQGNIPQYTFQTGVGMPQTQVGMPQSQTMYRPPQSPMI